MVYILEAFEMHLFLLTFNKKFPSPVQTTNCDSLGNISMEFHTNLQTYTISLTSFLIGPSPFFLQVTSNGSQALRCIDVVFFHRIGQANQAKKIALSPALL